MTKNNKANNSSKSKKGTTTSKVTQKFEVENNKESSAKTSSSQRSKKTVLSSCDDEAPIISLLKITSKNNPVSRKERLKSVDETDCKPKKSRGRKKSTSYSNNEDDLTKQTDNTNNKSKSNSAKTAQQSAGKKPRRESKANSDHKDDTIMKEVKEEPPDDIQIDDTYVPSQKQNIAQRSSRKCGTATSVNSRSSSGTACDTAIPSRRLTRLSSKGLNTDSVSSKPEMTVKDEISDDDSSSTSNKITPNQTENKLEDKDEKQTGTTYDKTFDKIPCSSHKDNMFAITHSPTNNQLKHNNLDVIDQSEDDDVICITDDSKKPDEKKQFKMTTGPKIKGCRLSRCYHHSPAKSNVRKITTRRTSGLRRYNEKIHNLVVDLSNDMFYHEEPYLSPIYISDDDTGSISCMPFTKNVSNENNLNGKDIETISLTDSIDSQPCLSVKVKTDMENNLEFSRSQFDDITANRLTDGHLVLKSVDCDDNKEFLSNDYSTRTDTNVSSSKFTNKSPSIIATKDTEPMNLLTTNIVENIKSKKVLSKLISRNKDHSDDNVSSLNSSLIDKHMSDESLTELNELYNCLNNSPCIAKNGAEVNVSNMEPIEVQSNKSMNKAMEKVSNHVADHLINSINKNSDKSSMKSSKPTYKRRKSQDLSEDNMDVDQGSIKSENKSVLNTNVKDVSNKVQRTGRNSFHCQIENSTLSTKKRKKITGDEDDADWIKEMKSDERKNTLKRKMIYSPTKELSRTDNTETETLPDVMSNIKVEPLEQVQTNGTPCKVVKYSTPLHSTTMGELTASFRSNFKTDEIDSKNDDLSTTSAKKEEKGSKKCTEKDRKEASKSHRSETDKKHRSGSKGDSHKRSCEDEKNLKLKREEPISMDRERKKHNNSLKESKEIKKSSEEKERTKDDGKKHSDSQRGDKKLLPKEEKYKDKESKQSDSKKTDPRHKTKVDEEKDKDKHSKKHRSQGEDEKASRNRDEKSKKLDSHKIEKDVKHQTTDEKIKDKDSKKTNSQKSNKRVLGKETDKECKKYDSKNENNHKNDGERKKDRLGTKYHNSPKSEKKHEHLQMQNGEKIMMNSKKSASNKKEENMEKSDDESIRRYNDFKHFTKRNDIKHTEVRSDTTLDLNSESIKLVSPKPELKSNVNHQNKITSPVLDKFDVSDLDYVEISQRDLNISDEDVESNKMLVTHSENLLINATPDILKNIQDETVQTKKEMSLSFSNSIKLNSNEGGSFSDSNNVINNTNQTQNILNPSKPSVILKQIDSLATISDDRETPLKKLYRENLKKKSGGNGTESNGKIAKVPAKSYMTSQKEISINVFSNDDFNTNKAVTTYHQTDDAPRKGICSSIKIGFHVKSVNIDGVPMFEYNSKLWKYADEPDKSIETVELHKYVPQESVTMPKEEIKKDSSTKEKNKGKQERGDNKRLSELEIFFLPYCRNLLRYNCCNELRCQSAHKFDVNFLKSVNFPDAWYQVEKLMSKPEEYLIAKDVFLAIVHWLGSEGKRNKLLESALYLSSLDLKLADSHYLSSCWSALVSAFMEADVTMINALKNILQHIASHSPPFKVEMLQKIIKFIGLLNQDIEEVWPIVQVLKKVSGFVYPLEFFERMMANTVRTPRPVNNSIKDILSDFTEEFLKCHILSLVNIDTGVVEMFSSHLISFKLHQYDLKLQSLLKRLYKELDNSHCSPSRSHSVKPTIDSVPCVSHTKESSNFVPYIPHMKESNPISNRCKSLQKDVSPNPKSNQSKGEPEIGPFDNSDNFSDKSSSSKSSHNSITSGRSTTNPINNFGRTKFGNTSTSVKLDHHREIIGRFDAANELPQLRNQRVNIPTTHQIPPLMSLCTKPEFSRSKDPLRLNNCNLNRYQFSELNSSQFSSHKSQFNEEPSHHLGHGSLSVGVPSATQPTVSGLPPKIEYYGQMKEPISRGPNMHNFKERVQNEALRHRDISPDQGQYGQFNKPMLLRNDPFSTVSSKSDSSVRYSINHTKTGSNNETFAHPFQKVFKGTPFGNEPSKLSQISSKSQTLGTPCSQVSVSLIQENTIPPKNSLSDDPYYSLGISVKKVGDNKGSNDNTKKSKIMALPFPREEGCYTMYETDSDSSSNTAYQKESTSHLPLETKHTDSFPNSKFSNRAREKVDDSSNFNKNLQQSVIWKDFKTSKDSQNFREKLNKMFTERKILEIFETFCEHSENRQTMESLAEDVWEAFSEADPTLFYPVMRDLLKMMESEASNYQGNAYNVMCLLGTVATKGITNAIKDDMWMNAYDIYNIMLCCGYSPLLDERFNKSKDKDGFSQVLMAIIICEIWTAQKAYDKAVEIITGGNLLMSRDQWNLTGDEGDGEMVKKLTEFLLGAMCKDVNDKESYLLLANFLEEVITSQKCIRGIIDVKPAVEEAIAIFHDFNSDKNYRMMLVSFYEFLLQVDDLNDLSCFSYRILLINFIRLKHERTEEIYSKCLQHRIYQLFNGAESYLEIQCIWTREEMFFILNKWFEAIASQFCLNKNFVREQNFIVKYKAVDMKVFSDLERPKRLIKIDQRTLDVHSRFNTALSACIPPITYEHCDLVAGVVKLHSEPCKQLIYFKLKKLMKKKNIN